MVGMAGIDIGSFPLSWFCCDARWCRNTGTGLRSCIPGQTGLSTSRNPSWKNASRHVSHILCAVPLYQRKNYQTGATPTPTRTRKRFPTHLCAYSPRAQCRTRDDIWQLHCMDMSCLNLIVFSMNVFLQKLVAKNVEGEKAQGTLQFQQFQSYKCVGDEGLETWTLAKWE
ncbi:hypothetical protein BAQU_1741 [Bifidobacterium aquikefiri]|uniref:Uncharacterized protein n=1 Tax=Bifidobacterium aquikefiri TaxID=1653207 RepID=A0A261G2E4_9BIFI|nr:hypothetical protein BAQU_1741 [Bifidobacterium aquikefiri]